MEEDKYEHAVCPSCEGKAEEEGWGLVPYYKTYNEIAYVRCKWCMDAGKVRKS